MSESTKRMKTTSLVFGALALVAVGVVLVTTSNGIGTDGLARSEALQTVKYENDHVPLANLPDEVHVPEGWQVESDEPFGPEGREEEENNSFKREQTPAEDEDIDSPLDVEEDENGDKYVADVDEDVIVTGQEANAPGKEVVAADGGPACFQNLQVCGFRRRCKRSCRKKCRPITKRMCKAQKFCKCFCKYFKNIKKAKRCVVYRRNRCRQAKKYQCVRNCKKFCKKTPRCYCCPDRHVSKRCKRLCKRISYKTKCGKCRCYRLKCSKYCSFVCKKRK